LTTVHVPHREMGKVAAQQLIQNLRSGDSFASVQLDAEVKMRGSLAAPASSSI